MSEEYAICFCSHGDEHQLEIDLECFAKALKPYMKIQNVLESERDCLKAKLEMANAQLVDYECADKIFTDRRVAELEYQLSVAREALESTHVDCVRCEKGRLSCEIKTALQTLSGEKK